MKGRDRKVSPFLFYRKGDQTELLEDEYARHTHSIYLLSAHQSK